MAPPTDGSTERAHLTPASHPRMPPPFSETSFGLPDDVTLPLVTHSCRLQWMSLLLSPRPPHVPPQHIPLPSAATAACTLPSPPPPPQVPHPSRPFIMCHRRLPVAPSCGADESFCMVCRASEVMADIKFSVFEENTLSADAWQPRHHLDHFSRGSQLCTTPTRRAMWMCGTILIGCCSMLAIF